MRNNWLRFIMWWVGGVVGMGWNVTEIEIQLGDTTSY